MTVSPDEVKNAILIMQNYVLHEPKRSAGARRITGRQRAAAHHRKILTAYVRKHRQNCREHVIFLTGPGQDLGCNAGTRGSYAHT